MKQSSLLHLSSGSEWHLTTSYPEGCNYQISDNHCQAIVRYRLHNCLCLSVCLSICVSVCLFLIQVHIQVVNNACTSRCRKEHFREFDNHFLTRNNGKNTLLSGIYFKRENKQNSSHYQYLVKMW